MREFGDLNTERDGCTSVPNGSELIGDEERKSHPHPGARSD